jgi:hypothetical protein
MNDFIQNAKKRMTISLCLVSVVVIIDIYCFFYLRFVAFKPKNFDKIEANTSEMEVTNKK